MKAARSSPVLYDEYVPVEDDVAAGRGNSLDPLFLSVRVGVRSRGLSCLRVSRKSSSPRPLLLLLNVSYIKPVALGLRHILITQFGATAASL